MGSGGATRSGGAPGPGGGAGGNATGGAGRAGGGGAGTGGLGSGGAGTGGAAGQTGLPAGVTSLFPPPGGTGVCPDPALRITFSGAPTLGTTGRIQVLNAAGTAVATVDMAVSTITDTRGGTTFTLNRPAFVDGNTAVIYLKAKALAYGQSYTVTVDAGALRGPSGALAISGGTWRFTTAVAAPSSLTSLSVAAAGGGAFCSVQGAVDALPANNSAATTISIAAGTYHEVIRWTQKNNITLRGADRKTTIFSETNNNNMNGSTATRSMIGIDNSSGVIIEKLTLHNLTPQGGSQAEALRFGKCDKCVVRDADIISLQDTLLWTGKIYADNCTIAGNVDYVWGDGAVYFNKCEIHTVGRKGYIVQSRNPANAWGYVFVDCKLTADSGITGDMLARIDVSAYPASSVAYVNCTMGSHIAPEGWTITGGSAGGALRFWEYQSKDPSGTLVNTGSRASGSHQMTASEAATLRDPAMVLGGWTPPL